MFDFTEYIGFFRVFDLLVGGKNDQIYWINILIYFWLLDLSTSCWEVKMIDFTEYIEIFRLFLFWNSWCEIKMINFTEYIVFFRLFDLLLWVQIDRFYWICWIFRLFDLLLGGQIDWFYWIRIFRLFELLVKWWEVKMIDFTEYIGFFRLFDFLNRCGW